MENKNNNQVATKDEAKNVETKGQLTFDDKVLKKIIGIALGEVDGLLDLDGGFFSNLAGKIVNTDDVTKGIDVEVGKEQIAVDMKAVVEYGRDIQNIYENMQKVISQQVKKMTGLDLVELNVEVIDIQSAEEYEKNSETLQDKVTGAAESTGEFASKQFDKVKDKVGDAKDVVVEKAGDAKDAVVDKANDAKDAVSDKANDAKDKVQDTVDNATKEPARVQ